MLVATDFRRHLPSDRLDGVVRMNEILPQVLARAGLSQGESPKEFITRPSQPGGAAAVLSRPERREPARVTAIQ